MLRDQSPLTAGAIAAAFPRMSRPAVSKHLRILRESDLVLAEQSGREWMYRLNVAALARMQRDWFEQFTPLVESALEQLKRNVENILKVFSNDASGLSAREQAQVKATMDAMQQRFGYTEGSARDAIVFLVRKRYA